MEKGKDVEEESLFLGMRRQQVMMTVLGAEQNGVSREKSTTQ